MVSFSTFLLRSDCCASSSLALPGIFQSSRLLFQKSFHSKEQSAELSLHLSTLVDLKEEYSSSVYNIFGGAQRENNHFKKRRLRTTSERTHKNIGLKTDKNDVEIAGQNVVIRR